MRGCVHGSVLGVFLLLGLLGAAGCAEGCWSSFLLCLSGWVCVPFLWSGCLVFVLFMLFVFCVLWWRMFSGIVRIYIIRYSLFPTWVSALEICFTASFVNQRLRWKDAKYLQKSVSLIWRVIRKALPLHPQSREMRQWLKYWKQRWGFEPYHFKKNFLNFFLKSFGGSKKVLTFASAFEKMAIKKSSLKDLDMNKQVVQDLL